MPNIGPFSCELRVPPNLALPIHIKGHSKDYAVALVQYPSIYPLPLELCLRVTDYYEYEHGFAAHVFINGEHHVSGCWSGNGQGKVNFVEKQGAVKGEVEGRGEWRLGPGGIEVVKSKLKKARSKKEKRKSKGNRKFRGQCVVEVVVLRTEKQSEQDGSAEDDDGGDDDDHENSDDDSSEDEQRPRNQRLRSGLFSRLNLGYVQTINGRKVYTTKRDDSERDDDSDASIEMSRGLRLIDNDQGSSVQNTASQGYPAFSQAHSQYIALYRPSPPVGPGAASPAPQAHQQVDCPNREHLCINRQRCNASSSTGKKSQKYGQAWSELDPLLMEKIIQLHNMNMGRYPKITKKVKPVRGYYVVSSSGHESRPTHDKVDNTEGKGAPNVLSKSEPKQGHTSTAFSDELSRRLEELALEETASEQLPDPVSWSNRWDNWEDEEAHHSYCEREEELAKNTNSNNNSTEEWNDTSGQPTTNNHGDRDQEDRSHSHSLQDGNTQEHQTDEQQSSSSDSDRTVNSIEYPRGNRSNSRRSASESDSPSDSTSDSSSESSSEDESSSDDSSSDSSSNSESSSETESRKKHRRRSKKKPKRHTLFQKYWRNTTKIYRPRGRSNSSSKRKPMIPDIHTNKLIRADLLDSIEKPFAVFKFIFETADNLQLNHSLDEKVLKSLKMSSKDEKRIKAALTREEILTMMDSMLKMMAPGGSGSGGEAAGYEIPRASSSKEDAKAEKKRLKEEAKQQRRDQKEADRRQRDDEKRQRQEEKDREAEDKRQWDAEDRERKEDVKRSMAEYERQKRDDERSSQSIEGGASNSGSAREDKSQKNESELPPVWSKKPKKDGLEAPPASDDDKAKAGEKDSSWSPKAAGDDKKQNQKITAKDGDDGVKAAPAPPSSPAAADVEKDKNGDYWS